MDDETFKNIITYIYEECNQHPKDSLKDIINEAFQSENVMFYITEEDEIIDI